MNYISYDNKFRGYPTIWGFGKSEQAAQKMAVKEAAKHGVEVKEFLTVPASDRLVAAAKTRPDWTLRDGTAYLVLEINEASLSAFHAALRMEKDTVEQFRALAQSDRAIALYLKLQHIQTRIGELG